MHLCKWNKASGFHVTFFKKQKQRNQCKVENKSEVAFENTVLRCLHGSAG